MIRINGITPGQTSPKSYIDYLIGEEIIEPTDYKAIIPSYDMLYDAHLEGTSSEETVCPITRRERRKRSKDCVDKPWNKGRRWLH